MCILAAGCNGKNELTSYYVTLSGEHTSSSVDSMKLAFILLKLGNLVQNFSKYPLMKALVFWSFLAKAAPLGRRSSTRSRVRAMISPYEIEGVRMLKTV